MRPFWVIDETFALGTSVIGSATPVKVQGPPGTGERIHTGSSTPFLIVTKIKRNNRDVVGFLNLAQMHLCVQSRSPLKDAPARAPCRPGPPSPSPRGAPAPADSSGPASGPRRGRRHSAPAFLRCVRSSARAPAAPPRHRAQTAGLRAVATRAGWRRGPPN